MKYFIIITLLFLFGCSKSPEEAFKDAKSSGTVEAYKNFLDDYIDAPENLKNEAKKDLYRLAFEESKKVNTVKGYNNYVLEYPNSSFVNEAKERAYNLSLIGKSALFYESKKFILESIWGALLERSVSYKAEYTGVIEEVLGDNVKLVIKNVSISHPSKVSYSYLDNQNYALNDFQKNIGDTRIVSKSNIVVQ